VIKKVKAILEERNAFGGVFSDIGEHSPIAGIRAGEKAFTENQCDIIVSVGGGSPVDASKAILYYHQQQTGGQTLLQIAVPTTLRYVKNNTFTHDRCNELC
jgi:alcohol dehydrogenase class IV